MSNSLWPHGLYSPWSSPGQDTGVGSLSLLQGIFTTQGSNPGLLHCRRIPYQLSHQGSPRTLERVAYPFSRGPSWPRNWTRGLLHCRQILYQLSHKGSIGWVRCIKMGISWASPLGTLLSTNQMWPLEEIALKPQRKMEAQIEGATRTIQNIETVLSTPIWCGEPWTNHGRDTLLLLVEVSLHICFFILIDFCVCGK